MAQRALLVGDALDHAMLLQARQTGLQNVARDPEVRLELVEAPQPEQDVAHDQQRPALAHHLECAGDRQDWFS